MPSESGRIKTEHFHRYYFTLPLIKNKKVLDIASGEGFGSYVMAGYAQKVIGVDIDKQTIKHAKSNYQKDNLEFKTGDCKEIPVENNSIDVIVSFETIEHHPYHTEMLQEFKRVLKDDGVLVISSPNKLNYSDLKNYKNPFHVKELYKEEFIHLLNEYFKNTEVLGQKIIYGSAIFADKTAAGLKFIRDDKEYCESHSFTDPEYDLAVCSDVKIPPYAVSVLEDSITNSDKLKQYENCLSKAQGNIRALNQKLTLSNQAELSTKEKCEVLQDAINTTDELIRDALKVYNVKSQNLLKPFAELTNFKDYDAALRKIIYQNKIFENALCTDKNTSSYSIRGYCIPCGQETTFLIDNKFGACTTETGWIPNWRERLVCNQCKMNNRQRLFASKVKELAASSHKNLLFLETAPSVQKWAAHNLKNCQSSGKYYLGYAAPDSVPESIELVDLNHLTFDDSSLDCIISFDNLIYSPNISAALSECHRVLKPGGRIMATLPFNHRSETSILRAKLNKGKINMLEPEVYHDSVIKGHKILLFNNIGWDIIDLGKLAGFQKTFIEIYYSLKYGHTGHGNFVFNFVKKK